MQQTCMTSQLKKVGLPMTKDSSSQLEVDWSCIYDFTLRDGIGKRFEFSELESDAKMKLLTHCH